MVLSLYIYPSVYTHPRLDYIVGIFFKVRSNSGDGSSSAGVVNWNVMSKTWNAMFIIWFVHSNSKTQGFKKAIGNPIWS